MEAICRSIPLEERSRVVAFVFGGLSVGSVMGYAYLMVLMFSILFHSLPSILILYYLSGFLELHPLSKVLARNQYSIYLVFWGLQVSKCLLVQSNEVLPINFLSCKFN
ncbi:putative anion transporter 6 [Arachis hypogaea]|nr:putative anion transporter 6 [Arachis hypogaea]